MRRRQPEAEIQKALIAHLRARGVPNLFYMHVPNGGVRSKAEAAIFAGLGVVAGVPDLIVIRGGQIYALELKADRGRVSEVQRQTHERMQAAGATVAVACGLDAAIRQLEAWSLLRGRVTSKAAA
jgi:hypothetical protein